MSNILCKKYTILLNMKWQAKNININPSNYIISNIKWVGSTNSTVTNSTITNWQSLLNQKQDNTYQVKVMVEDQEQIADLDKAYLYDVAGDKEKDCDFSRHYKPENISSPEDEDKDKDEYTVYKKYYSLESLQDKSIVLNGDKEKTIPLTEFNTNSYALDNCFELQNSNIVIIPDKYRLKSQKYESDTDLIINGDFSNDDRIVQVLNYSVVKEGFSIYVPQNINLGGWILQYTVTPCMPYGKLDSLAVTNTIDFSKIGKPEFTINEYKYYVSGDVCTMKLDTDIFTTNGERVTGIKLSFSDVYKEKILDYDITGLASYTGTHTISIPLDGSLNQYMKSNPEYHNAFLTSKIEGLTTNDIVKYRLKPEGDDLAIYYNQCESETVESMPEDTYYDNVLDNKTGVVYKYRDTNQPLGLLKSWLYKVTITPIVTDVNNVKIDKTGWKTTRYLYTSEVMNDYYFDDSVKDYKTQSPTLQFAMYNNLNKQDVHSIKVDQAKSITGQDSLFYDTYNFSGELIFSYQVGFVNNYNTFFVNSADPYSYVEDIKPTPDTPNKYNNWDFSALKNGINSLYLTDQLGSSYDNDQEYKFFEDNRLEINTPQEVSDPDTRKKPLFKYIYNSDFKAVVLRENKEVTYRLFELMKAIPEEKKPINLCAWSYYHVRKDLKEFIQSKTIVTIEDSETLNTDIIGYRSGQGSAYNIGEVPNIPGVVYVDPDTGSNSRNSKPLILPSRDESFKSLVQNTLTPLSVGKDLYYDLFFSDKECGHFASTLDIGGNQYNLNKLWNELKYAGCIITPLGRDYLSEYKNYRTHYLANIKDNNADGDSYKDIYLENRGSFAVFKDSANGQYVCLKQDPENTDIDFNKMYVLASSKMQSEAMDTYKGDEGIAYYNQDLEFELIASSDPTIYIGRFPIKLWHDEDYNAENDKELTLNIDNSTSYLSVKLPIKLFNPEENTRFIWHEGKRYPVKEDTSCVLLDKRNDEVVINETIPPILRYDNNAIYAVVQNIPNNWERHIESYYTGNWKQQEYTEDCSYEHVHDKNLFENLFGGHAGKPLEFTENVTQNHNNFNSAAIYYGILKLDIQNSLIIPYYEPRLG